MFQRYRSNRRLTMVLPGLVLALLLPLVAVAADPGASPAAADPDSAARMSGALSLRYVYRTTDPGTGKISDQDAYGDLWFDVARPRDDLQAFHFLGSVRSDLDGNQDVKSFYPLEDIGDTYGRRTIGTVYEAFYVMNSPFRPVTRIRIGRQAGTRDAPVFFDGLSVEAGGEDLQFTVYGGAAVHFYEVNATWGKDTVGGAGVDYRLLHGLILSADWVALSDKREFDPNDGTVKDRMASFKVRQQFDSFLQYTAKYRHLDGEPRDLSVAVRAAVPSWDAELSVNYLRQFRDENELTTDLSPYADVIGRSAPFQSVDLRARKTIADRFSFDAGYFRRSLLHRSDEGPFNKEYSRSYLSGDIADLFVPGLSWTLTAERWDTGTTGTVTYGTDVAYRRKRKGREARIGVGSYYSLFKYDYYAELGLRDKVRTYYVDARYPVGRSFSLNGRYEFERAIEDYQTARLGMRYDF